MTAMIVFSRFHLLRLLSGFAAILLSLPSAVWAWAGVQHIQVNKAAGRNVPDEMSGFRAFSRPMALPGIYPDLWKEADPAETPRHYFEPDRLPPGTDIRSISPDQTEAFAKIDLPYDRVGIAPWTITDLLAQMTEAMRTNDWLWAARCGATMGHYVADLHMPLHCTKNYNGDDTGQNGIHLRWESNMAKAFFHPDQMTPGPAVYLEDPFRSIMEWIGQSAARVPDILKADLIAKRSANGRTDTERYYRRLWELSGDIVGQQLGEATTHLSSLWYTAWVNAGKPAIPAPFDELPTTSVFSGVGIDPLVEGGPVGTIVPRQKKTYDAIILSFMGFVALLVVASSIYRGIQAKKYRK
jgi:hypothetical protein